MNTVKSRLLRLAALKDFRSLDLDEDYPKMLKRTGRSGPRTIPILFEESWRRENIMKIFRTGGKDIFHRIQTGDVPLDEAFWSYFSGDQKVSCA